MKLPTQHEALQYVEEQELPRTGHVLFYEGKAFAWSRHESELSAFVACVVAVDVTSGAAMRAVGGDYWKGADRWEELRRPQPNQVHYR